MSWITLVDNSCILPFYEIGKLLKFIQISYGYRKNSEVLKTQV